jgi:hypothetical protein
MTSLQNSLLGEAKDHALIQVMWMMRAETIPSTPGRHLVSALVSGCDSWRVLGAALRR